MRHVKHLVLGGGSIEITEHELIIGYWVCSIADFGGFAYSSPIQQLTINNNEQLIIMSPCLVPVLNIYDLVHLFKVKLLGNELAN